jgi:hypothetical protein
MALAFVKGAILTVVTVVAAICIYHYLIYPLLMEFNEGGTRADRYDVDVSDLMKNNITKEDSVNFFNHLFPNTHNIINTDTGKGGQVPKRLYKVFGNSTSWIKVADCKDSIIQFKLLSKIQNLTGDKVIFFIVAIVEDKVIPNYTIKADYFDEFVCYTEALAVDYKKRIVMAISDGRPGTFNPQKPKDQKSINVDIEECIQDLIADDHYYYDLPILKIKNPAFWNNISGDYNPIIGHF